MAIFEIVTPIKSKKNINAEFDLSKANLCKIHNRKPDIMMLNKNKDFVTAECDSPDCLCYGHYVDIIDKWNKFNPAK